MKREYKRELNHTYLILSGSEKGGAQYQECMLERNKIEGLLSCQVRYVDNKKQYYYEISSKQPLCHMYSVRKMRYEEFAGLVYAIEAVIRETENYLLDSSSLLLTADMIYWDLEQNKAWLIYYPEKVSEEENLAKAGEDILELIDYSDEEAVEAAHYFYECSREKNFCWSKLTEYIEEKQQTVGGFITEETDREDEKEAIAEAGEENLPEKGSAEGYRVNTGQKQCQPKVLQIILKNKLPLLRIWLKPAAILVLVLAVGIYLWCNYIFSLFEMAAGALSFAVLAAVLVIRTGIRIKRQEAEESEVRQDKEEYQTLQNEKELYWREDDIGEESGPAVDADGIEEELTQDCCYGQTVCLSVCEEEEERRLEGRIRGREVLIFLDTMPFLIGKMKGRVSYVLPDASVSRLHAAFREENGRLLLRDLQSKNGTYKNEIRLEAEEELEVRPGDEIRFGKLRFTYR